MKNFLKKNIIKKICLIVFLIYVVVIFFNQQQTLASYNTQKKYYIDKIDEAKKYNDTLISTRDNLDSKEYIESISREWKSIY